MSGTAVSKKKILIFNNNDFEFLPYSLYTCVHFIYCKTDEKVITDWSYKR